MSVGCCWQNQREIRGNDYTRKNKRMFNVLCSALFYFNDYSYPITLPARNTLITTCRPSFGH